MLAIIRIPVVRGATIIRRYALSCSRTAAARVHVLFGSPRYVWMGIGKGYQIFHDGIAMTPTEIVVLVVGILSAL